MSVEIADERLGTTVAGKYRLDRVLGSGGMGIVYAGVHVDLGRPVAVKFLHPHLARDPKVIARFFAEAQAAARLRHPNVVDVLDVGRSEDGAAYMALELLSGEPLSATLARVGRLSPSETCRLILPILEALEIAHDRGIIHRDLKPENIFVSRSPSGALVPKVLDFGIAKLLDAGDARATETGHVVGTPTHLAPERARGTKEIGGFTDVWSMGVVLHECLTGRHPYDLPENPTPTAVMVAIVTQEPRPLEAHMPGAPPALAACVDRALEKDPKRRWPSARELRGALAKAAEEVKHGFDDATAPATWPRAAGAPGSVGVSIATEVTTPRAPRAPAAPAIDATSTIVTPARGARALSRAWIGIAAALVVASSLGAIVWATRDRDAIRAVPLAPHAVAPPAAASPTGPARTPSTGPVVDAPVADAPVVAAPVEAAPVEAAPVEAAPVPPSAAVQPGTPEPPTELEPASARAPAAGPEAGPEPGTESTRARSRSTRARATASEPTRTTPRAGQVSLDQF